MKALIVGAAPVDGSDTLVPRLAAESDLVIAADAAAEWCLTLGVRPDLAVGDFDSAAPGAVERLTALGIPVRTFSAEKDDSDLDLAVVAARDAGADRMVFSACLAGRLDHSLATLGTLLACVDLSPEIREPHSEVWALSGATHRTLEVDLPVGKTVSVMAVGKASGVTLSGLKYPLKDARLVSLSSRGLSNMVISSPVRVSVAEGTLLVMTSELPEADHAK